MNTYFEIVHWFIGTKIRFPHALVMTFLFKTGRFVYILVCLRERMLVRMVCKTCVRRSYQGPSNHPCSLKDKLKFVLKATYQHARNLAFFVTFFKTVMVVLRKLKGGQEHSLDAFLSGIVGGYFIFGEENGVNQQVCIHFYFW